MYAAWRGIKYANFLVRRLFLKRPEPCLPQPPENVVVQGPVKIVCADDGIKIFWNDAEVTAGAGLNVSINTLGLWTDSTRADWRILERGEDCLKIKVIFKELPLSQTWIIRIDKEPWIHLDIEMEIEEWLCIDELRILCLISPRYKSWLDNFHQQNFPRQGGGWQDLCLDERPSLLMGARFPVEGKFLPAVALEPRNIQACFLPLAQNPPADIPSRIIGFRDAIEGERKEFFPGMRHLFSGRINLYAEESLLDAQIENLRRGHFGTGIGRKGKDRKRKVLLVNLPWQKGENRGVRAGSRWPHIKDKSEGPYMPFPFFLAYAAALLRKYDIDAEVIDAIAEETPADKFLAGLRRRDFDILAAETSVPSFDYDKDILKEISSRGVPIVLCGPHPEIYREEFSAENGFVEFVLFGEYEWTLLELMQALSRGERDFSAIAGLIWRDAAGRVVKNPPREPVAIDTLPWPDREGLPMEKYWDLPGDIPLPSAQMVASRGCPFGCNFCLWPQALFGGRTYRARNVKDVADEMEYLIKEKGYKSVYFDDDTFNVGKPRMLEFCVELIRRDLHKIPWAIMAKADLMDKEILDQMKQAGLYAVKYGVESAAQELVDRCGKNLQLKKAEEMIEYTKSLGIKVHLTFSFGLPGETRKTIRRTVDYALKLDPHSVQFSIITPFPGTALFEELDREGRILTRDFSLYDGHYNCVFQPEHLTAQELEQAKRYAYRRWSDYQRKKRGFKGDARRFMIYWRNDGARPALKKLYDYSTYVILKRKKFIGKI